MKKLTTIIIFILGFINLGLGQNCYTQQVDHTGLNSFYHPSLDDFACDVVSAINDGGKGAFPVLAYNIYPTIGFINPDDGFPTVRKCVDEDLDKRPYYLAIIKEIHVEEGDYTAVRRRNIQYRVKVKLPDTYSQSHNAIIIASLENLLTKEGNDSQGTLSNTVIGDKNIMIKFLELLSNTNLTTEVYESAGYSPIPLAAGSEIRSTVNATPIGHQYVTLEVKNPITDEWVNFNNEIPTDVDIFSTYEANVTPIITSSDISTIIQNQASRAAETTLPSKVNFTIHHDLSIPESIFMKFDIHEADAESLADLQFIESYAGLGYGLANMKELSQNQVRIMTTNFAIAKTYILDVYDVGFEGGLGCGLVDGLFATIESLWKLSKSVVKGTGNFFQKVFDAHVAVFNYISDVIKVGFKEGVGKAFLKLNDDARSTIEDIGEAIEKIKDKFDLVSWEKLNKVYLGAKTALLGWLETIAGGGENSGYEVGKIAFEVIFGFLTAGAGASAKGAKFFSKITDLLRNSSVENIAKGFQGMLGSAAKSAAKGSNQAKRINRCKILGKGCFVKDTPVLMANNPFKNVATGMALAAMPLVAPIQDVQVDDMVKAYHHEDMYLTASNVANDIYVPGWQDYDYLDITPETWQVGKFIIEEEDGSVVEIEANRPKKWFEEQGVTEVGDGTFLIMKEFGVFGNAELLELKSTNIDTRAFKLNESGKVDRPVITTFKRIANEISNYTFSNGQVISCTPNHPFYSSGRQAYLPIGELTFGESIQTSSDRAVKFIGVKAREKGEHVYNFEVWREHNYFVGSEDGHDFLLVHNYCWKLVVDFINDPKRFEKLTDWWATSFPAFFQRGNFFEQVMRQKKFKDWKYTGKGFDQNGIKIQGDGISNYKAIDFYKDDVVASMKSTKYANPDDWLGATYDGVQKNKKHIDDLLDGLTDGKFPQYTGAPLDKTLTGMNKAELHVFRPNMEGFTEVQWANSIKSYAQSKGYSTDVINKLTVKVSRMEDHL